MAVQLGQGLFWGMRYKKLFVKKKKVEETMFVNLSFKTNEPGNLLADLF